MSFIFHIGGIGGGGIPNSGDGDEGCLDDS